MDNTLSACILFFCSAVAIAIGYSIVVDPSLFYLCPNSFGPSCLSPEFRAGIGKPLYKATYLLPLLFFGLIFVRKEVFFFWWKYFLPAAIAVLVILIFTPIYKNQILPARVDVAEYLVIAIFAYSVIVAGYKHFTLKGQARG